MKGKFASLLTLLLAVTFVAGLVTQVAATDCDKAQEAQVVAEEKGEVKAKVEEEKGKTTLETKEVKPEVILAYPRNQSKISTKKENML